MVFDKGYRKRAVIKANVEAVQASAKAQGLQATFLTLTFKDVSDWKAMKREVTTFVKRLRKATRRAGLYVWERGRRYGRPHVHFALDGYVWVGVLRACTKGMRYVGHEPDIKATSDGNLGKYFYKEMWKQSGRNDLPARFRRWGKFGKLPGGQQWVRVSDVKGDSAWARCLEYSWTMTTGGESKRMIWERAKGMYLLWLDGKFHLDGLEWQTGPPSGACSPTVGRLDGERELREGVWFPARELWPNSANQSRRFALAAGG